MKKRYLAFTVIATMMLLNCSNSIAIIKRGEWEAHKAELKRMQDLMDTYNRNDIQQIKVLRADIGLMVAEINHNLNRLSGQLEENRYGLERLSQTTEKLSERKYIIKSIARTGDSTNGGTDTVSSDSLIIEDKVNAQKLFQIARKDFSSQDYERAIKGFEDIIAKFPSSTLVDDCLYWIGESYFVQKKYKEAVLVYKKIAKEHPLSELMPATMFKAGLCFEKLADEQSRGKVWSELLEKFPYSDEALQVKARQATQNR